MSKIIFAFVCWACNLGASKPLCDKCKANRTCRHGKFGGCHECLPFRRNKKGKTGVARQ